MARGEAWTDERLDDLRDGMYREFDQVQRQFDKVHAENRDLRTEMDAKFSAVDARFETLNARFDATQRTLIGGALAIVAAIIAAGIF